MRCVSVSQVAILALLGACAAVAWRMGDAKGINPALCAVAGFIFGPPFLLFLLWVPANSGAVPGVGPAPWNDPDSAPAEPREVRHVAPPPPRDAD